jgi:hypothetical protein
MPHMVEVREKSTSGTYWVALISRGGAGTTECQSGCIWC